MKYQRHPGQDKERVVALYTSAWIEITALQKQISIARVALYTSAWIEIPSDIDQVRWYDGRTLHECVD